MKANFTNGRGLSPWVVSKPKIYPGGRKCQITYAGKPVDLDKVPLVNFSRRVEEQAGLPVLSAVFPTNLDVVRISETIKTQFKDKKNEIVILDVGSGYNFWAALLLDHLEQAGVKARFICAESIKQIVNSGEYFSHPDLEMIWGAFGDLAAFDRDIEIVKEFCGTKHGNWNDSDVKNTLTSINNYRTYVSQSLSKGAKNILDFKGQVDVVLDVWRIDFDLSDLTGLEAQVLIYGKDRFRFWGMHGFQSIINQALDVYSSRGYYSQLCAWHGFSFNDILSLENNQGNTFEIQLRNPFDKSSFGFMADLGSLAEYPWEKEWRGSFGNDMPDFLRQEIEDSFQLSDVNFSNDD